MVRLEQAENWTTSELLTVTRLLLRAGKQFNWFLYAAADDFQNDGLRAKVRISFSRCSRKSERCNHKSDLRFYERRGESRLRIRELTNLS